MPVNYSQAGEFSDTAVIQEFIVGAAALTKGRVCQITPLANQLSTLAITPNADASLNGPYAVTIEAGGIGDPIRAVVYGEVSVDASGNCFQGAIVFGQGGAAVTRVLNAPVATRAPTLGRVMTGAANNGVATVWVGIGGI